ncbi:hypothetical protein ACGF5O_21730 [Streptomyces sp. NPDC048291]|uniref:hypothetical protein n=1 Tax=Streptomyces sp. NPDC048291 TaxID=3365530 RepID=UPI0037211717
MLLTAAVVTLAAIIVVGVDNGGPVAIQAGVIRQPSLAPGEETLADFKLPPGYNSLAVTLLLNRVAGSAEACPANGKPVDIRVADGHADRSWRVRGAVDGTSVQVPIARSADSVTLSLAMSGSGNCQYKVQLRDARVIQTQDDSQAGDWLSAENVVAVGTLVLGVAASGAMVWYERRIPPERVESGRRVRSAEEGLEAALRRDPAQTGSRPQAQEGGPPPDGERVPDLPGDLWQTPAGSANGDGPRPDPEVRGLALPALWKVTHARLDHYHQIALGQAERSFRNAQIAMGVGFLLLVGFSLLALRATTTAASVVSGALGITAAGLAGYVSRTFVRSQEISAGHLRAYFDQPLEFSRYLAAERLIADVDMSHDQRAAILGGLVRSMTAPNGQSVQIPPEPISSTEPVQHEGRNASPGA